MRAGRRFTVHRPTGNSLVLAEDHPAVIDGRTLFPSRVGAKSQYTQKIDRVLKSGFHSRKIGSHVTKGKWFQMPIYTLTLEERATCPRTCSHWHDCYGNKMHFAPRQKHGAELERRLETELPELNQKYPDGFVVRLHVLGDFYSLQYVEKWWTWMLAFLALHVFGYMARQTSDPIGRNVFKLHSLFPERWWVRLSDRDNETWLSTGESGITCPVQTGKTACCGTCGLCWTAEKPIRFLVH